MTIATTLKAIIVSIRPLQWLKNLALYGAIFFGGQFFNPFKFTQITSAFLVFCAVSSAMYLFNDIVDAPKDRLHPIKRNRPIAAGTLSPKLASLIAITIVGVAVPTAWNIQPHFFGIVIAYIALQLTYSLYFRNIIIMDALVVATGFVMRVFAGGFAGGVSISSWLALTTIGLATLLSFGKRRAEKTLLEADIKHKKATRKTLEHYPTSMLNNTLSMSASLTILAYALFSFQISSTQTRIGIANLLPHTLRSPKWMMLTIPVVIYGVIRYLYVVHEKTEGESPEKILIKDKPLFWTVITWALMSGTFIYLFGG